MDTKYKIIQIMPAAGWYATYHECDDHFDPLVCFALIEEDDEQLIVPMISMDSYIDRADAVQNFDGIVFRPDKTNSQKT